MGGPLSNDFLNEIRKLCKASVFIETGTYFGNTVESVRDSFEEVISIELSEDLFQKAVRRFNSVNNVRILNGDSAAKLKEALLDTKGKIKVIWLDAHYSGEGTSKANSNTPIIGELQAIRETGTGKDIIMIDDIRMFGKVADGFLKHEAIEGYPDLSLLVDQISSIGGGYDCYILADILLALPRVLSSSYTVSLVLNAISKLRIGGLTPSEIVMYEKQIQENAKNGERETILALPDIFAQQLQYGLGGDFSYWRYLIHKKEGSEIEAKKDFDLWQRCLVH